MIELKTVSDRPLLNTKFFPIGGTGKGDYTLTPREYDVKELMWWIKRTPECIGIGKRIATDIISNISFTAIDKKLTGRPSKTYKQDVEEKAMQFSRDENVKQKLINAVLDWVFTGDSYIWTGKISDKKIKEIVEKYNQSYGVEFKAAEFMDEEYNSTSKFMTVPSTTVEVRHNGQDILYYKQTVGGTFRTFYPEQIVHAKFMDIDGDPYGFTPMRASASVIKILGYIKDYGANYFANGGTPDMIFKFPKEMAGSPNAKAFEQVLQKYKEMKRKHGNMIVYGEMELEKLNEWNKDMEFRQHAIYLTGVLAHAFNMPADTLSSILGVDIKGTAMGSDVEDTGYNRNIKNSQEYWENLLNSQIFNKYFGVDIKFEKTFRQDDIRLSQYRAMNVSTIEFMFRHDYPVTDEFIHSLLKIPREFLTNGKIERESEAQKMEKSGSPFQKPIPGENQQKFQAKKKLEQQPQQENKKPTGV